MKKFSFWLWATVIFQFVTAAFHAVSLFVTATPQNETEKQLFGLMDSYHMPLGMGFNPTFADLLWALSSCFAWLYLFAGIVNLYLYKRKIPVNVMNGIMGINVIIFGISFGIMAKLTFLPPIICTGLVLVSCVGAYFTANRGHQY